MRKCGDRGLLSMKEDTKSMGEDCELRHCHSSADHRLICGENNIVYVNQKSSPQI
jgi:hypothetical protein